VADRVELAFRDAALRLLGEGERIVVAVSGGGDSVALLHLLARHAPPRRLSLSVAHLDHGLRRGAAADRRFVERLSRALAVPCDADRVDVAAARRRDESPEEAARRVRRAFLLGVARRRRATRIATGHTLDDQAETVLMRLVRGAGPTALAGMRERGPGPFVKPLLGVGREALREWLARHDLDFRDDPSNRDLRFERNRVRRLVLPALAEGLGPRAASRIVRAARRIREDAEILDDLARDAARSATRCRAGRVSVAVTALRTPPALARRVARLVLERAGVDARRVAAHHVEGLVDLAAGGVGRSQDLPGGWRAVRRGDRVVLGRRG